MKKAVLISIFTLASVTAHADSVGVVTTTEHGSNPKIVDFTMTSIKTGEQKVKNPNYQNWSVCSSIETNISNCDQEYVMQPVFSKGFTLQVQFDAPSNEADTSDDDFSAENTGTRYLSLPASQVPGSDTLVLSRKQKERVAFANDHFQIGDKQSETHQVTGQYYQNWTTEGPDTSSPLITETYPVTHYWYPISAK
jgi:hypothetical protein